MSNTAVAEKKSSGWGWLFAGGIFLTLLGLALLMNPTAGSVAVTVWTGWLLMIGGVTIAIVSIANRKTGGMWLGIILGLIMAIAGGLLAFNALQGTIALTMLMAIWFVVDGTLGSIGSLIHRGPAWGWQFASGLLSLVVGIMLINNFPSTALWVLGVFGGIVLFMRGFVLMVLAFEVRRIARES